MCLDRYGIHIKSICGAAWLNCSKHITSAADGWRPSFLPWDTGHERWEVKLINHRSIEVREPVITLSTNDRAWKNEARGQPMASGMMCSSCPPSACSRHQM